MSDLIAELRERSLRAEQEGEPMALLDEAPDFPVQPPDFAPQPPDFRRHAAALRGLLERMK